MYDGTVTIILTQICDTNTTLSAECPTGVAITPSTGTFEDGDVLTCSAEGYELIYTWTGTAADGAVTVSHIGSSYTLPGEGDFHLTCTATISHLSCTGSATDSVNGNAVGCTTGKYCMQLNTTVTILMLITLYVS